MVPSGGRFVVRHHQGRTARDQFSIYESRWNEGRPLGGKEAACALSWRKSSGWRRRQKKSLSVVALLFAAWRRARTDILADGVETGRVGLLDAVKRVRRSLKDIDGGWCTAP